MMKGKTVRRILAVSLCGMMTVASFSGCGSQSGDSQTSAGASETDASAVEQEVYGDGGVTIDASESEMVPLAESPAPLPTALMPEASGKDVRGNSSVRIDVSNNSEGYIMVDYLERTSRKLKLIVKGPSGVGYTYNINKTGSYETFPLSDGNGIYTVTVYRNVSGTSYATVYSTSLKVTLTDEFAPYLLPNQYVNYTSSSTAVKKAAELTADSKTDLDRIQAVYTWVVKNISYDHDKAANVKSGYLPDLDNIMQIRKGICFDYASLMTAMLRSQDIPCKLVVGYSGKAYHAWINAYTDENGWVNSVIYFDGSTWKLMDPTFASTGHQSRAAMKYIGDGANYDAKYLY